MSEKQPVSDQNVGLILIGDELLNGSRQDKHMAHVLQILQARGMSLSWVRMIGDAREEIVANLLQTAALDDLVFSFGGIGATPDDQTRAAAAEAFGQNFIRHPDAKALIEEKFGESAYPNRILMADLPEESTMIPNSINQVPGFKVEHHHFVPGFPDMAWPMVEWVLDTYYPHLRNDTPNIEWRWDILGTPESTLLPMMNDLLEEFEDVKLSSLPSTVKRGDLIDFGLKGPEKEVTRAAKWLENQLKGMAIEYKFRETN